MKKKILLIIPVAVILFLFIACENQEFMDVESKSAEEPMQSVAEVAAHKDYFALWSIDPFVAKYHTELSIYNYSWRFGDISISLCISPDKGASIKNTNMEVFEQNGRYYYIEDYAISWDAEDDWGTDLETD